MTPTEELLLELLIARTRLGHHWWTFSSNAASRKAANALAYKGLVVVMHGIVESSFRAHLTDEARQRFMDNDYTPPILGGPL
ncbi:MarR family transcriptional regulator [Rhodococcus hoagii]|nr:MarR family transcriptional regulator [Prescottella equi]